MTSSFAKRSYIVCVDDDRTVLNSLRQELADQFGTDYRIEIADSGEDGLDLIRELAAAKEEVALVISDQLMPGMKGDEFLIQVHQLLPRTRKVMLTGQAGAESVGRALNFAGLYRFISKPWDPHDLFLTVEQALKSYAADNRLEASLALLQTLNRYARQLSEEVKLETWSATFLQLLTEDAGLTQALLWIPETGQVFWKRTGTDGCQQLDWKAAAESISTGLPEEVARTGVKKTGPDQSAFEIAGKKPRSWACIPLSRQNRVLGVLILVHDTRSGHFSGETAELVEAVTAQVPSLLDNSLLYESLEAKVQERTQIIEQKNQDILDSIRYARRIQQALLPAHPTLSPWFADMFILYSPKDIVSGDIYWWVETPAALFLAAIDCTGHGVPGAFMSVLAQSLLNQIIYDGGPDRPDELLARLHRMVVQNLQQNSEGSPIHDGMDMALIRIDRKEKYVDFALANRPVWWVSKGEVTEFKPDRIPIGGNVLSQTPETERKFTNHRYSPAEGSRLYLFSDGVVDQFGGELERKFTPRRLQQLILDTREEPLPIQHLRIRKELENWKGERPQTDDWMLLGFEF